jgi:hypothetical protein
MTNTNTNTNPPCRAALVRGGDATRIAAYLPTGYEVVTDTGDGVLIAGRDCAGWTLDGYVLPRLASGLMFGNEVDVVWCDVCEDCPVLATGDVCGDCADAQEGSFERDLWNATPRRDA